MKSHFIGESQTTQPTRCPFTKTMLTVAGTILLGGTLARGQILVNGGFEQPVVTKYATLFAGATNLAPWVIGPNSVDVALTNNGYTIGAAYDGGQYVDMDGTPGPGQISQSFATTAGRTYYLSFAYANNYVNQSSASMRVRIYDTNGNIFGPVTVTHSSSVPGNLNWTLASGYSQRYFRVVER